MNQRLVRYELSKTIRRPAFIFALLIAVAVAIAAALEPWANLEKRTSQPSFFWLRRWHASQKLSRSNT